MSKKSGDLPQVAAAKRASMGIAWSVVAGVAYLGLISAALNAVGGSLISANLLADNVALYAIPQAKEVIGGQYASLASAAIAAIPVAIVVGIAIGIAARLRPTTGLFSTLLFLAGLLGLIGVLLLAVTQFANPKKELAFAIAIGTIVVVGLVLRLEHVIRRFYGRSPAIASLILAALILVYFVLTNTTSISSVFLDNLNIWLALVAFAIVVYSGYHHIRAGHRLRKGR